MKYETFESHIQDAEFSVETGRKRSHTVLDGPSLPLEQIACETTSLDPYHYTWSEPDNCVLTVHRKEVKMINHGSKCHFVSGNDSTTKRLFEV